jgi:UDPglucose 6-dehydrogenase
MQITIIGSGYVGIVTGVCFANLKNSVTFVDIDEKKLNLIHSGISPIYEKKLEELIQLNQNISRYPVISILQ